MITDIWNFVCSIGIATHQQVVCIGLVHIQVQVDMVTDMTMNVMKIEMDMVMEERENTAIRMMIDMADMGTQIVVMEIDMAGIMKSGTAEMDTEMMITGEGVEVLMVLMQEAGALIETETVALMMMVNPHLGIVTIFFIKLFIYIVYPLVIHIHGENLNY